MLAIRREELNKSLINFSKREFTVLVVIVNIPSLLDLGRINQVSASEGGLGLLSRLVSVGRASKIGYFWFFCILLLSCHVGAELIEKNEATMISVNLEEVINTINVFAFLIECSLKVSISLSWNSKLSEASLEFLKVNPVISILIQMLELLEEVLVK